MIPLFPERRAILCEADELAEAGRRLHRRSKVPREGHRATRLAELQPTHAAPTDHATGRRHCRLAAAVPLALCSSRETELAAEYPLHVVTAWLGNTPKIAMKHYLMVTDSDYELAAAKNAAAGRGKASHSVESAEERESDEAGFAGVCDEEQLRAKLKGGDDRTRTCTPFGTGT